MSDNVKGNSSEHQQVDLAVQQGGAYEVLRKRLVEQGQKLQATAAELNKERLQEFGDSKMEVIGRFRVRTENNCIGRDIVQVGNQILFGYNVFIGLKTQTRVEDVFSLYKLEEGAEGYDVTPVDHKDSFLGEHGFIQDFTELYAYYKDARLLQLVVRNNMLLAAFQIGERISDVRVFRWSVSHDGTVNYIDARGERDIALPAPFDFEWQRASREMTVHGRFSHLNILDTLFVETTNGDLTIKIENNTETGAGIYSEPVEDKTQSLDDAVIDYARVGSLVLLKILPYRENEWRGLIYNMLTQNIVRNDAIVQACVQLPEDHGIIFPGGYYLQNGEHKAFDSSMDGMQFKRMIKSPNGEDVMYIFYEPSAGKSALFVYNTIQRSLQNPIFGHGYARLADGKMVLFYAEGEEPTRIHPMQVWQTPFASDEYAAARPASATFMGKLGNAELVRGISNLFGLSKDIENEEVSAQRYQLLTQNARRLFDAHHWIDDSHCHGTASLLREITATAESVLDEYEKVQSIRRQSDKAIAEATREFQTLMRRLTPENWKVIDDYVEALNSIKTQRGHLLTIREYRYIDTESIDTMNQQLQDAHARIGEATAQFLTTEQALIPFTEQLAQLDRAAEAATTAKVLSEQITAMDTMSRDLDMLSELMASLKVDDPTQRTRVVEAISGLYAKLNQAKARAEQRKKSLGSAETVAQFSAQLTLFNQSITSAIGLATDPEKADEQMARLLIQLEELESQFGEHEEFLADILSKREELVETFEVRKQSLTDERQRKAQSVFDAANRILEGLSRRTERLQTIDELNAFFAGDALILKLRELSERLRALKDSVKADDIEARIKAARDQAIRALRDQTELFEDSGNIIKLGPRHRFSVNTQPLDLTLLPRQDTLAIHLTGTDFYQPVRDDKLLALKPYWDVSLDSESAELYRAEYLAAEILQAARDGREGLTLESVYRDAATADSLTKLVRDFAAPRYREGYERGIHDHDASLILSQLLPMYQNAGALIYPADSRAVAVLFWWKMKDDISVQQWRGRAQGADAIRQMFGTQDSLNGLRADITQALQDFLQQSEIAIEHASIEQAANYLLDTLMTGDQFFVLSKYASTLVDALEKRLDAANRKLEFEQSLRNLQQDFASQWQFVKHWMQGLCADQQYAPLAHYALEAAAMLLTKSALHVRINDTTLVTEIKGLLGQHARIQQGVMTLSLDDFLQRIKRHQQHFLPQFRDYQTLRQELIQTSRETLRIAEFKARPLSSFVRNKLINDVYLPVIGDNLAKQIGTFGDNKRTDLMGLLMMISPPGYGKTTLMEYVAHRLGLIFMKINGPALGHEVKSLDPAQAPDATSAQELEKLNLALEMGNNVMLYVDDIQHTHPEFLQKFISLCDGTRRIEGVWQGKTKTYDMRGKKFAVVMAGNPYTESGEVFKIPDMLANRADIYNLGEVIGGMEEAFLLSYIENSLTSNPVLAPLAVRDMNDLYLLVQKAQGKDVSTNELSYSYSSAEINEIVTTLQRMITIRDVVYKVNQQYIASAAQADKYRVEPAFKLQGSYRNMNKLSEKVSPVMNEAELQQLINDHYLGEAQLLTTGAEENLLKLAELRQVMTQEQLRRWQQIKQDFLRNKAMGGDDADVGTRVVSQLADIAEGIQTMQKSAIEKQPATPPWGEIVHLLSKVAHENKRVDPADLNALHVALRDTVTPLLDAIGSSQQQQLKVDNAVIEMMNVLHASGLIKQHTVTAKQQTDQTQSVPREQTTKPAVSRTRKKTSSDAVGRKED